MNVYLEIIFLSFSLAVDASVISMANGLHFPKIPVKKLIFICLIFGLFQSLMPLLGYWVGHSVLPYIVNYLAWISFLILGVVGANMIIEGIKKEPQQKKSLTFFNVILQGIASSVDAFSIGFTFAEENFNQVLGYVCVIGSITCILSCIGFFIGKKFGMKLGFTAEILGGILLILLGLKILS